MGRTVDVALPIDEDLAPRLPLPLAQLYRQAHNAKTALERRQAAYYLWEASLKLLPAVALVEYARLDDRDAQLNERLKYLTCPSLGHWWDFARRLISVRNSVSRCSGRCCWPRPKFYRIA